jgi:hypothetical protein
LIFSRLSSRADTALRRLGDDSLQVLLAYRLKQIYSIAHQVIHKQHRGLDDLFEQTLPLDQRQSPQILAIIPQQIERIEVLGAPAGRSRDRTALAIQLGAPWSEPQW